MEGMGGARGLTGSTVLTPAGQLLMAASPDDAKVGSDTQ
jgi:hypothetical protein